ncbi:unnamed protein product [Nezara viridula]|uniref:Uncharacterized protein n=1 Tax=Nezara viridula TaxID=85310 RepID=A0A9P0HTE7_NEZVI|nr:unnamed protein product [Nezara viridula]
MWLSMYVPRAVIQDLIFSEYPTGYLVSSFTRFSRWIAVTGMMRNVASAHLVADKMIVRNPCVLAPLGESKRLPRSRGAKKEP